MPTKQGRNLTYIQVNIDSSNPSPGAGSRQLRYIDGVPALLSVSGTGARWADSPEGGPVLEAFDNVSPNNTP
jgi:hypothetical protein